MGSDKLVRHTSILFITITFANVLGLVFHLSMGRLLGPAEYGVLAALFSFLYVLNFGNRTIEAVLSKFTATGTPGKTKGLFMRVLGVMTIVGVAIVLILVFGKEIISKLFHFPDSRYLVSFGPFIALSLIVPIFIGTLNGYQKFWWIGLTEAFVHFQRVVVAISLVLLGYGLSGTILSLNISVLIWIGILAIPLYRLFRIKARPVKASNVFSYSFPVLISFGAVMIFLNLDVLVVKYLFSPEQAGLYAAAATIAKIIWLGSAELVGSALFPKAANNPSRILLKKGVVLTSVLAFFGATFFSIFSETIVRLLFGPAYVLGSILPQLSFALAFFSLSYVIVMFSIAKADKGILWILGLGLIGLSGAFTIFHGSLQQIALVVLSINALQALILFVYHWKYIFTWRVE